MPRLKAQGQQKLGCGNARRARAHNHHRAVANAASRNFQGVKQPGADDNGRAVLVVVHDRNIQRRNQSFFNVKAFRRLDILQINAAKGGGQHFDCGHHIFRFRSVQANIKGVHIGKHLE